MALPEGFHHKERAVAQMHRAWHIDAADVPMSPGERRDELKKQIAELVRGSDFELPPLPGIAQEVFAAAARPNISVQELARIVHRDAFIAGRVLRVANSAHYAFGRPAETLHTAIVRIGVDELRNIVVALGLKGEVFRARGFENEADLAWRHSLATAIGAGMLAAASKRVERHRAFLGGLLHNVGHGIALRAAMEFVKRHPQEAAAVRQNIRGVALGLFRETGGLVARRWNLDEGLQQAIVYCDSPSLATVEPALALHVTLGRAAGFEAGLGPWESAAQYSRHPDRDKTAVPSAFHERFLAVLTEKFEAYETAT